jgi:hypothetical protein
MSIQETIHFDKNGEVERGGRVRATFRKVFLALVILLVALLGYGAGRLSAGQGTKGGVTIRYDEGIISALSSTTPKTVPSASAPITTTSAPAGSVYASSKGTKYYYMNCKSSVGAANKITFASASMAEASGYTLASGCKSQ